MTHGRTAAHSPAGPNPTKHKNPRLRDMIKVPPKLPKVPRRVVYYFKIVHAKIDAKLIKLLTPTTCDGTLISYTCGHEKRAHHSNCPLGNHPVFVWKCSWHPSIKYEEWCADCDDLVRSADNYDEDLSTGSYNEDTPLLNWDATQDDITDNIVHRNLERSGF